MLQDFFYLELYFGTLESAQSMDDLVRRYGWEEVRKMLSKGWIEMKKISCRTGKDQYLCWLSEGGRRQIAGNRL